MLHAHTRPEQMCNRRVWPLQGVCRGVDILQPAQHPLPAVHTRDEQGEEAFAAHDAHMPKAEKVELLHAPQRQLRKTEVRVHQPSTAKDALLLGMQFENDVYIATSEPHGNIEAVVTRKDAQPHSKL